MAFFDTPTDFARPMPRMRQHIARLFETPFDRRARRLAARVKTLRALSDADLAARGMTREDILRHVFAGKPG